MPVAFSHQIGSGYFYDAVLSGFDRVKEEKLKNTLFLPFVAIVLSGGILGGQWISAWVKANRNDSEETSVLNSAVQRQVEEDDLAGRIRGSANKHGGSVIFGFNVARLLGCLALLGLSLFSLLQDVERQNFGWSTLFAGLNLPEVALVVTYCYASLLAALSLTSNVGAKMLKQHVIGIVLVAFAVYVSRDVWPLATFTERPMDLSEGPILWAKIAVLTFTAIVVPLFVPRTYVPADPENPAEVINPEETASVFSWIFYTFMNPTLLEASRVPHLPADHLPPLRDDDYSQRLTTTAFPHLDPFRGANRNRHIFWGLLTIFFWEYVVLALCCITLIIFQFASPIAINRILTYLENPDEEFYVRPWFWVLLLFFGPFIVAANHQYYMYLSTRSLVRAQCILTELIFEHSLRIRLKAEPSGDAESLPTPPTSLPADTHASNSSEATTVAAGSTSRGPSRLSMASTSTTVASVGSADTDATAKGKAKEEPAKAAAPVQPKAKVNLLGKINTLVTVDLDIIVWSKDFLVLVVPVPLQLVLSIVFLYVVLGWSAMVGLASIVVFLPAPGYIARWTQRIHKQKMEKTDARTEAVTQTIGVLRMVKLFGWERKMEERLQYSRDEELAMLFKEKMVQLADNIVNFIIPLLTMIVTFSTFTLVAKQPLTPSKIFSSITVFDAVRMLVRRASWSFGTSIKGKVSLDRLSSFLRETELLDNFSEETCTEVSTATVPADSVDVIGFNNATFAWSKEAEDRRQTPSVRTFRLQVPDHVRFRPNVLNLIVGPTGSGKTSMLMALLGEMHFVPSGNDSWYNLPREGGIAYAAQESWVQNETIKSNILFGSPYNKERYDKVISQCALETDLALFDAGDETEVGEKGLTLSGGQKARVTLARAVYSSAQILLLDDVLAALDVHTAKHIVNACLQGELLGGRTVILVTHNVALTQHIAEHVIAVGLDGVASEVSDISELLAHDETLAKEVEVERDEEKVEEEVIDAVKPEQRADGKLVVAEEIEEGRVSWKSVSLYLRGFSGDNPVLFFAGWILAMILMEGSTVFSAWFLGFWGSQYETHDQKDVSVVFYLELYSAILVGTMVLNAVTTFIYAYGSQRASQRINARLIDSMLHTTFRWLDETPVSRVIARCTQDIGIIDNELHFMLKELLNLVIKMIVQLAGVVLLTPIFLLPGLAMTLLGVYLGSFYLKAQMSVKREMSNARAPVLAHFGGAIAGLVSLRAYGAQNAFKKESFRHVDHYTRISRTSYNLNRWIASRMDLLGCLFTAGLAAYLLVTRKIGAGNTGFSLNITLQFCVTTLWITRAYNELEIQGNSLERIQGYIDVEHEPEATEAGKPPAAWPKSGELQVERLSARYSSTGPKVLSDISFHVKSGERVGIVGRTGSGKSSLSLSLLRCILTEGEVYYDGIPTKQLNLDSLRSNVTIIPQVPELLSGTLRRNLDPFEQHDDATLNSALAAAGLFSLQSELDIARITLDSDISSGGNNLSVGQRQIIALARAMVRHSKLLILDEATSAIDHKTDSIIQATLRNELPADTTILTIAHRLQTIMDADKIMVLDAGRIVEYDSPQALLRKSGGYFKALVDESGDKNHLYAMAEQKASGTKSPPG